MKVSVIIMVDTPSSEYFSSNKLKENFTYHDLSSDLEAYRQMLAMDYSKAFL
jgi:hypothetical protein